MPRYTYLPPYPVLMMLAVVVAWFWLIFALSSCSNGCPIERRVEEVWATEVPEWDGRIPLNVVEIDDTYGTLRDSAEWINDRVGCVVLEVNEARAADVLVATGWPPMGTDCASKCTAEHLACTCMRWPSYTAEIYYTMPGMMVTDYWVYAHELVTHVLGLAHDVGRRKLATRQDAANGPRDSPIMLLSNKDRRALHERYCK